MIEVSIFNDCQLLSQIILVAGNQAVTFVIVFEF